MFENLINIDGTYVNPSWIHFIRPHEIMSCTNPGYKIDIDMGGEHCYGTTVYKTERDCIDAITKIFGKNDSDDEVYTNDEADKILKRMSDCLIEEEDNCSLVEVEEYVDEDIEADYDPDEPWNI